MKELTENQKQTLVELVKAQTLNEAAQALYVAAEINKVSVEEIIEFVTALSKKLWNISPAVDKINQLLGEENSEKTTEETLVNVIPVWAVYEYAQGQNNDEKIHYENLDKYFDKDRKIGCYKLSDLRKITTSSEFRQITTNYTSYFVEIGNLLPKTI
jgi:hypothetical protein